MCCNRQGHIHTYTSKVLITYWQVAGTGILYIFANDLQQTHTDWSSSAGGGNQKKLNSSWLVRESYNSIPFATILAGYCRKTYLMEVNRHTKSNSGPFQYDVVYIFLLG